MFTRAQLNLATGALLAAGVAGGAAYLGSGYLNPKPAIKATSAAPTVIAPITVPSVPTITQVVPLPQAEAEPPKVEPKAKAKGNKAKKKTKE